MSKIGYSTGAIALGDFAKAISLLEKHHFKAIELSALRISEVKPLVDALAWIDLSKYAYISFHAPSAFEEDEEEALIALLQKLPQHWPIILHPDAIHRFDRWEILSERIAIENMDRRKSTGRSVSELLCIFEKLPKAKMCLDIGHSRQVDSSMIGSYFLLKTFADRIIQLHVSEVDSLSRHDLISFAADLAFRQLRQFIPKNAAVILESRVREEDIEPEASKVRAALAL